MFSDLNIMPCRAAVLITLCILPCLGMHCSVQSHLLRALHPADLQRIVRHANLLVALPLLEKRGQGDKLLWMQKAYQQKVYRETLQLQGVFSWKQKCYSRKRGANQQSMRQRDRCLYLQAAVATQLCRQTTLTVQRITLARGQKQRQLSSDHSVQLFHFLPSAFAATISLSAA